MHPIKSLTLFAWPMKLPGSVKPEPLAELAGLRPTRFSLARLPIRQRLPLLMGILLLATIIASTWVSYRAVKDSALEAGGERLRLVTQQLAAMFQQSGGNVTGKTLTVANDPAIRAYLRSPLPGSRPGVVAVLQQFASPQEPGGLRVELRNADHSLALALPE